MFAENNLPVGINGSSLHVKLPSVESGEDYRSSSSSSSQSSTTTSGSGEEDEEASEDEDEISENSENSQEDNEDGNFSGANSPWFEQQENDLRSEASETTSIAQDQEPQLPPEPQSEDFFHFFLILAR